MTRSTLTLLSALVLVTVLAAQDGFANQTAAAPRNAPVVAVLAAPSGEPDHGNTRPVVGQALRGAPHGTSRTNPTLLNALDASQLGAGDEDRGPAFGAPPSHPIPDVAGRRQPETTKPSPASLVTLEGILAYADPSYGPRYLAIRQPVGTRVELCGPAACLSRTSTDFGPSPWMARQGRIADVSAADFTRLCGVPLSFGICNGTLTVLRLPETSMEGDR